MLRGSPRGSSLIICEGISTCRSCMCGAPWFPHYMWGYIRPSLRHSFAERCSLIICEGISSHRKQDSRQNGFPHYMWGYIGGEHTWTKRVVVPSLYVRVYHSASGCPVDSICSLIICEGISIHSCADIHSYRFPHYMWGYIALKPYLSKAEQVPSLYVRVYHVPGLSEGQGVRSLIICEGISAIQAMKKADNLFPHYMWGYIMLVVEF